MSPGTDRGARLDGALRDKLVEVFEEQGATAKSDAPLARLTTFGIGGAADLLVTARSEAHVLTVLQICEREHLPLFILGGGSNLLIADAGIRGLVLKLGGELAEVVVDEDGSRIQSGAGAKYPRLTRAALDCGWESAKGWIGTPGTVGGALKMNAGTRDGEIGDTVVSVTVVELSGIKTIPREKCGFGYRTSAFPARAVLTRTDLQCDDRRIEPDAVAALDAEAKALLAKRHATQPKQRSAGSIFKNPPGDYAGRLIQEAGLKGMQIGQAQLSPVHANFVVNLGGASASDVVALAQHAQQEVRARFGVELEWEVKRVGAFSEEEAA